MIRDPDLVHYACIAQGTIILAEFNSKDAALGSIAAKCLRNTPPYHAAFTHTVRSRTYSFLIDNPFVYFAIFDEYMENSEGLAFLRSVRVAFAGVFKGKSLVSLTARCFQGEFNPVFRQLLGSGMETVEVPTGRRIDQSDNLQCDSGSSKPSGERDRSLKKMKNRLLGESNDGNKNAEKKESGEDGGKEVSLNGEASLVMRKKGGFYSGEMLGHQRAKKIWKKQVWIILSLDLFICLILFVIWLWVCSGFKCMDN